MRRTPMTTFLLAIGVLGVLAIVLVGGVVAAAWPVGARLAGTDLVLINRGAGLKNVEIVVSAGDQQRTIHLVALPSGETTLSTKDLPDLTGEVTGVSVSGSRMGIGWTHYAALRLDATPPLRSASGGE